MAILLKLFYRLSTSPMRISAGFFVEIYKLILKFSGIAEDLEKAELSWKKRINYEDLHFPISKLTIKN